MEALTENSKVIYVIKTIENFLILIIFFLVVQKINASSFENVGLKNGGFALYGSGTNFNKVQVGGTCDRVFLDKRKIGFFHIQLMPVLVIKGVKLHFGMMEDLDWIERSQESFVTSHASMPVELRDVTIDYKLCPDVQIHFNRMTSYKDSKEARVSYRIEGVVISENGQDQLVYKAQLQTEAGKQVLIGNFLNGSFFKWDMIRGQWLNSNN